MKKLLLSLLSLFLAAGLSAQLGDQPLLLHLEFEDEDDIAYNDQDMTYDEAEPTAEYTTDAKIGAGAASFDGLQYIIKDLNEGALSAQATSYTWAAWVKTEAPGGTIVSWASFSGTPAAGNGELEDEEAANDGHQAGVQALFWGFTSASPCFDVGWVDLFEAETPINDGAWHHVVLTNDIETPQQVIYIDGVQVETGEIDVLAYEEEPDTPVEEFVLKVGYSTSLWPADEPEENQWPYFEGVMDDFRMYGAALSEEEVTELFGITSVKGYQHEMELAVYPNPASDFIIIKSKTIRDLDIFNAMGQLVQSEKDLQDGSMITITDLRAGLYFVRSGDATQKLIIE
jgi:hypothetical protein